MKLLVEDIYICYPDSLRLKLSLDLNTELNKIKDWIIRIKMSFNLAIQSQDVISSGTLNQSSHHSICPFLWLQFTCFNTSEPL